MAPQNVTVIIAGDGLGDNQDYYREGVIMLREILNSLLERKANLRVEASQVRTQTERDKINRELERVQREIDAEKKRIPSRK